MWYLAENLAEYGYSVELLEEDDSLCRVRDDEGEYIEGCDGEPVIFDKAGLLDLLKFVTAD